MACAPLTQEEVDLVSSTLNRASAFDMDRIIKKLTDSSHARLYDGMILSDLEKKLNFHREKVEKQDES